jgi:hypothetical protein
MSNCLSCLAFIGCAALLQRAQAQVYLARAGASRAGALTGLGVTWQASRASDVRWRRWLTMMLIASVTAAIGCVGVGGVTLELSSSPLAWMERGSPPIPPPIPLTSVGIIS